MKECACWPALWLPHRLRLAHFFCSSSLGPPAQEGAPPTVDWAFLHQLRQYLTGLFMNQHDKVNYYPVKACFLHVILGCVKLTVTHSDTPMQRQIYKSAQSGTPTRKKKLSEIAPFACLLNQFSLFFPEESEGNIKERKGFGF